jgi:hypothetical protein
MSHPKTTHRFPRQPLCHQVSVDDIIPVGGSVLVLGAKTNTVPVLICILAGMLHLSGGNKRPVLRGAV